MKRTTRKKKVTETIKETYKLDDDVNLNVTIIDGKMVSAEVKVKRKTAEYVRDGKKFREYLKLHAFHWDNYSLWNFPLGLDGKAEELFDHIQENGYDRNNVFFIENDSHNVKDIDGKYLDMLVEIDYIKGFRQKGSDYETNWDWDALVKYLKKHKNVIKVEEEEIPYYNSEFSGQKGLYMQVLVPEEWREYGKNGWDQKAAIFDFYSKNLKDNLGVKQFIKD